VFGDLQLKIGVSLIANDMNQTGLEMHSGLPGLSLADDKIVLDSARLAIRKIDFKPLTAVDPSEEYTGPFVVQAVAGGDIAPLASPEFVTVSIPIDDYGRISYRLSPLQTDESLSLFPDDDKVEFAGNTLIIKGSFLESVGQDLNQNGIIDRVPFELYSDLGANIILNIPDKFSVIADALNYAYLVLMPEKWLAGTEGLFGRLAVEDLQGGSSIILTDDSSSERIRNLLNEIEANVVNGVKFGHDLDGLFEESDVDAASFSERTFDASALAALDTPPSDAATDLVVMDACINMNHLDVFTGGPLIRVDGPLVMRILDGGIAGEDIFPSLLPLGIPPGPLPKVQPKFASVFPFELPPDTVNDVLITELLADNTLAISGYFFEAADVDIDGSGDRNYVHFILVSDDTFLTLGSSVSSGETAEQALLDQVSPVDNWFVGTLPLLQSLDPAMMSQKTLILADTSSSSQVRDIVNAVKANFQISLP